MLNISEELLELYKKQNPVKYKAKFETPKPIETPVEEAKEVTKIEEKITKKK